MCNSTTHALVAQSFPYYRADWKEITFARAPWPCGKSWPRLEKLIVENCACGTNCKAAHIRVAFRSMRLHYVLGALCFVFCLCTVCQYKLHPCTGRCSPKFRRLYFNRLVSPTFVHLSALMINVRLRNVCRRRRYTL